MCGWSSGVKKYCFAVAEASEGKKIFFLVGCKFPFWKTRRAYSRESIASEGVVRLLNPELIFPREHFRMNLPDEPTGWSRLQAMAQQAPDADTLARIIDEMNRLLDKHEQMAEEPDIYFNRNIELQVQEDCILE